jgi:hypothetical protein
MAMIECDQDAESRDQWLSPIAKLGAEAISFNDHVAEITGLVGQDLMAGRIAGSAGKISMLSDQLSAISMDASCILPRIDRLAVAASSPSALLVDSQKLAFLPSNLVLGSVGSVLCSGAAMAGTLRIATDLIRVTEQGQVEGLRTNGLFVSPLEKTHVSIDTLSQGSVLLLGNRLKSDVSTFGNLLDTSLATSRLSAEIYAQPIGVISPHLAAENQSLIALNTLSAKIYDDLAGLPTLDASCFLFQAPTIQPYTATRATAVFAGIDEGILDQLAVPAVDEILDELGGDLEGRLEKVNPDLLQVYQESVAAIESGRQGWIRHASVSFRTLFTHLLRDLAPDLDLLSFFDAPESQMSEGKFKRDAQLHYIFRDVATGAYARLAEQDIQLAEATFYPMNDEVHRLSSGLSDKQMRVLCRRIQGCISVVLEAAGY